MTVMLTDVARQAGVSLSTASRAFSSPDRIGKATLDRIMAAAEELNYDHAAARRTKVRVPSTATVAMIVPDIGNPVFAGFVKAAQAQGWHRKQTVLLTDTDGSPEREREIIRELESRVDGFIICSPRLPADDIVELCGATPLILVNRESAEVHSLVSDSSIGLRQTVEYLRVLGHGRIAYVQGSPLSWSNQQRVAAIEGLCAEAGITLDLVGWQAETMEGGEAAAASVVATGATAVIAHNDLMALGVIAGATSLGLAVPGDLSVVGIDDTPLATVNRPALTSIDVPLRQAAVLAVDLLHEGFAHPDRRQVPRHIELPTQLVVRDSAGPVRDWTPQGRLVGGS